MTAAPTSKRREATRRRLLDAAVEVFAQQGMEAASVEAVSERAGFTRGAFYSNFDSKDELILALMRRLSDEKLQAVSARVREIEGSGEMLSAEELVERVLEVTLDSRVMIALAAEIRLRAMRDPRLAAVYLEWDEDLTARIAEIIVALGSGHRLSLRIDAHEFARLILQTWEDTSGRAVIAGLDDDDLRRQLRTRTTQLVAGLVDPA